MAVTPEQVKKLREITGAGMMDCKRSLDEFDGDMDKALEALRIKNIAKAIKKGDRIASEGAIIAKVSADGKHGVVLEVNCETDFVARGDLFKNFALQLATAALQSHASDVASLMALKTPDTGRTWEEERQELVIKVGENVNVRRFTLISAAGQLSAYMHGTRIGVLVDTINGKETLGQDLAMHIAASNPQVIAGSEVPPELVAKEREIYLAQAADSGKPAEIVSKMIDGRVAKFLDEVSLLGQPFVKDPSTKVAVLLKNAGASVHSFVRYELGEGIAKKEDNFVAEVMAQARGGA